MKDLLRLVRLWGVGYMDALLSREPYLVHNTDIIAVALD